MGPARYLLKVYCLLPSERWVFCVLPAQKDSTTDFPPATSPLFACLQNRDHSPDSHPTTCLWKYRKSGVYKPDFFFSLLCIVNWRLKLFLLQQKQQGGNTCCNYLRQAGNKGCRLPSHAVEGHEGRWRCQHSQPTTTGCKSSTPRPPWLSPLRRGPGWLQVNGPTDGDSVTKGETLRTRATRRRPSRGDPIWNQRQRK